MSSRIDAEGRAERGSQRQMQIYVDRRRDEISAAILQAFPDLSEQASTLVWRSPLRERRFAEFRDRDFLEAIGCEDLEDELKRFWPVRGPVWDGLVDPSVSSDR